MNSIKKKQTQTFILLERRDRRKHSIVIEGDRRYSAGDGEVIPLGDLKFIR